MLDMNLTAMSDLTFLLLITFIITFPMIEQGLPVKLPDGKTQEIDAEEKASTVTTDRDTYGCGQVAAATSFTVQFAGSENSTGLLLEPRLSNL